MITHEMIFDAIGKRVLLLNPEDIASICNVDVKTLYNKKCKGELPFRVTTGLGSWQVSICDLLEYLNSKHSEAKQEKSPPKLGRPSRSSALGKRTEVERAMRPLNKAPFVFNTSNA